MTSPDARRFERFSLSGEGGSSAQSDVNLNVDASGAMEGKLAAVQPARDAIAAGLRVYVISMRDEGNLLALLNGEQGIGTQVVL
jgi:isopentenyl phosphate kinase